MWNFYDIYGEHLTAYPVVEVATADVRNFGHRAMRPKSYDYFMQAPVEDWPIVTFVLFKHRKGDYLFPVDGMHRIQAATDRDLPFIRGIVIPEDDLRDHDILRRAAWETSYVKLRRRRKPKMAA